MQPSTSGLHALPHAREHTLTTCAIDKRGLPGAEHLGRAFADAQSHGRRRFGFCTPNFDVGIQRLQGTAHAGHEAAAADGGNHRHGVRCVLENFESHGCVAGNEILIVERVHERAMGTGEFAIAQSLPRRFVRYRNEPGAERAHSLDLCPGRRLNGDHGAGHTRLPRRIRDALPGISRADGPDAAASLRRRQHGDGIHCATQLVRVGGLQVLQFEPDSGGIGAQGQAAPMGFARWFWQSAPAPPGSRPRKSRVPLQVPGA